ncbi:MAG: hypothetical protein NTU84_03110 [Verrucomicrobia bacterium]|nr:hypothetical protein [Verrucomicrobiota bacterium]
MVHQIPKIIAAITLLCIGHAEAQLAASLKITKKQYLAGEQVLAVVTVTNHAGRELVFQSDGRFQWLDFSIKNSAVAVIHPPGRATEGTSTNRVFFSQSPGRPYWTQKVGIPGRAGQTREFRILNFSGDTKSQLYAQVRDGRTGESVRTFLLGDTLMLRKPSATIDRNQRLHVMFLTTPTMWAHYEIDTDGRVANRQIHQRGAIGDPQLITMGDGSVRIGNSIPYDAKAAAEARKTIC